MKLLRNAAPRLPILILAALALSTTGCLFSPDKGDSDDNPPPVSNYKPQTSPQNVLDNLREAYEQRELPAYERLFDPVEFKFVFDPIDLDGSPDLPPFWGWADERRVHERMFESEDVLDIRLSFVKGTVQNAEESDGQEIDLTWKKMYITGVELEVETRNPDDPTDNIIYKVSGDRALYFFKEYPEELVDDGNGGQRPIWRITEWRDQRVGVRPL